MGKTKDLLIMFVCLLGIAGYFAFTTDWEDLLRPVATSPRHLDGKIAQTESLKQVRVEPLPQTIYDSLEWGNKKYARYITGNEKYILLVVFGNKPDKNAFSRELSRLFKEEGFSEYYRKHIIDLGNRWNTSCVRMECPALWVHKNCSGKICIIHPQQKQVVMDSSGDVKQLKTLLEKYKEW